METFSFTDWAIAPEHFNSKGSRGGGSSNQILHASDKKGFMATHEHTGGLSDPSCPLQPSGLSTALHSAWQRSVSWALGRQPAPCCVFESMDEENSHDTHKGGHLCPPVSAAVSTCGHGDVCFCTALPALVSKEQNNSDRQTSGEQLPPFRLQLWGELEKSTAPVGASGFHFLVAPSGSVRQSFSG